MEENTEKPAEKAQEESSSPVKDTTKSEGPPKKNPLLAILVILNTIVIAYLLIYQMNLSELSNEIASERLSNPSEETSEGQNKHEINIKEGHILNEFPIEPITANLARPDGPQRFINISIVLVVETTQNKPLEEILNKLPTFRDDIIAILNTLSPRDVLKLEGREVLKNILKKHINQNLKRDEVKQLLFTAFKVS
ncbi:MAG: hypothetical protein CMK92_06620 [Pseudomonas sp.]|nr:hypothetical protein [Pseudomonas sp.]